MSELVHLGGADMLALCGVVGGGAVAVVSDRRGVTCPACKSVHGEEPVGYRPAVIPPDPERDKRVAARRAADAAAAGRALDRLLAESRGNIGVAAAFDAGWATGYAQSELHHNGHYGVPDSCERTGAFPDVCGPGCGLGECALGRVKS